MKYMRRTAGYIWTNYKTNAQIAKELKITPILDKLLEYKRNWIKHVNRMPRNRLPRVMKRYSPTGRRNHGRPLKRLLDTSDRNGSTSGPTPWQIYDDDDDDDDEYPTKLNLDGLFNNWSICGNYEKYYYYKRPSGTKTTHIYKNTREKLLKTIAPIECNKICKIKQTI